MATVGRRDGMGVFQCWGGRGGGEGLGVGGRDDEGFGGGVM